jgi:hypothetical protein
MLLLINMNEFKNSWFQFINIDREIKNRLSNIKKIKKSINPFSIDILNKDERKIAEKYYNKKLLINKCLLFYHQLKYKTKYSDDNNRDNKLIRAKCNIPHIGQRKLLITEVWFLSQYNLQNIKKEKEPPIVIYPGAAPGTHILYLSKLFPNVEFHLYDMSRFDINLRNKSTKPKNVFLHSQLFLDEETEYWKQKRIDGRKIYLVSDIRALTGKEKAFKDKENVIHIDNILQYKWIEEIRPESAMIKWRVPFSEDKPYNYKYLDGNILLQPWGGISTTETRLIVECPNKNKPYKYKSINSLVFEEKMAAFNNTIKYFGYFTHPIKCSGFYPYDKNEIPIQKSGLGMDHCWNCSSELLTWCLYLGLKKDIILNDNTNEIFNFMKKNNTKLIKLFNDTTYSICRPLQINCHGLLPYKTMKDKYEHFFNNTDKERFIKDLNNLNKLNKKNYIKNKKCFYKHEKAQELFFINKSNNEKDINEEKRREKKGEQIGNFFD